MYNSSVFESIKAALEKNEKNGSMFNHILKFKPGNTYVLRFLPNTKNPDKTFYNFFQHGWESFCNGEYVSALSLQTIGKPDPISMMTWRIKKSGTPEEKKKAEAVKWSEQVYVNVLVVDDPVTPTNNGTVKIFRFGRKLKKMIESAVRGEDAAEFGPRVFDLSANGVNFKLKAEKQGDYTTYDGSRFTSPVDLNLSDSRKAEILDSVHDLESVNTIKSEAELMDLWNKHFVCEETVTTFVESTKPSFSPAPTTQSHHDVDVPAHTEELSDEAVADLLKGFEN